MLAIAIENYGVDEVAIEPVTQARLDRFAFATILRMDNDFGSRISRGGRSGIGRAVIDHQDIIELLKRAPDNIGDMFFFEISGNDRRDRLPVDRVVRGHRHFSGLPGENPPRDMSCARVDRTPRARSLLRGRFHRRHRSVPAEQTQLPEDAAESAGDTDPA